MTKCPINIMAYKGRIIRYDRVNDGYSARVLAMDEPLGVDAELRAAEILFG